MSNEYLRNNDSKINTMQAENLLAKIEADRKDDDIAVSMQGKDSLWEQLYAAFKEFFSKLGQPTIKKRLWKVGLPPISSSYNNTMREIRDDITVAYSEESALANVVTRDFNYSEASRQSLLNKVKKLASISIDYSLYTRGIQSQSLYGVDDFSISSKIDYSKLGDDEIPADIITNEGVITLKRTGSINLSPEVNSVTGIQESIINWDPNTETGGYEGLYFGKKNEARPEGGKWHVAYSPDGNGLYDVGATEEDLLAKRLMMFDDNPDTFWEVEQIGNPIVGYDNKYSAEVNSSAEYQSLVSDESTSPNVDIYGNIVVSDSTTNSINKFFPSNQEGTPGLVVNFTVFFPEAVIANWINLVPHNFGQTSYMEILSIQTSNDGQSFSKIDAFDNKEDDNIINSEANAILNPADTEAIMSPDEFKYAGQGIWAFSPRKIKAIKFYIRQPSPYINPYDILRVTVERTVTTTTTTKTWYGKKKESTDRRVVQEDVDIPYLTGQVTGFDVMDLEPSDIDISAVDTTAIAGVAGSIVGGITGAIIAGASVGGPVGALIGALIGSLFGSKKTVETTVGPQTISKQWVIEKTDKERYSIGIRDININSYTYAESSAVVSKEYFSPKPISKIMLEVDEVIPKVFYTSSGLEGTENEWIKYYVSVDNGVSWNRISPRHHKDTVSSDGINLVPEIININSDITIEDRGNPLAYMDVDQPVYAARIKAVLFRPTDIDSAINYTPVLSRYALQLYPFGGL